MLYDKKWDAKIADPYSFPSLVAWIEKQPARRRYDISHGAHCLLGQFAASNGAADPERMAYELEGTPYFAFVAIEKPRTFGAALKRARALAR